MYAYLVRRILATVPVMAVVALFVFALLHAPNLEKAKALIAQSGYNGEKIVLMDPTDQPVIHGQSLVSLAGLRAAGLNVELQAMDWGTLITRRASKAPIGSGGWNLFHTWFAAPDLISPAVNGPLRANDGKAWFGWPDDPELERLRTAWFDAPDLPAQKAIAAQVQARALETLPCIPLGQLFQPTAFRSDVRDIVKAAFPLFWGVRRA